ncbi:hypothetical protein K8R62_03275 [bacterium]|nr:hypothetical protein [bacterium]
MANIGKAYGFFECKASKIEIELELPSIRKILETPSALELSLVEDMDNVKGDGKLTAIAQKAKQNGINYMLEVKYPNVTNKDTSDELANILNQAYQSNLYGTGEPFNGVIVYEENGEYIFKE